MTLEELKQKLYQPKKEIKSRPKGSQVFEPGISRKKPFRLSKEQIEEWTKTTEAPIEKKAKHKGFWLIMVLMALISVILGGVIFWQFYFGFSQNKVILKIIAPEKIVGGERVEYQVRIENRNRTNLKNVQLTFYYPEDSEPLKEAEHLKESIEIGELASGEIKEIVFPARVFGVRGSQKKVRAKLVYQPRGLNTFFEKESEAQTEIVAVSLALNLFVPEKLVNGQEVNFFVEYINQSESVFRDVQLKLNYPSGFHFRSSEPQPISEDNVWMIGDLNPGEHGKIFIQGIIEGQEGESKTFEAQVGVVQQGRFIAYAYSTAGTQITLPPLSISQTVNQVSNEYIAEAGEMLEYQIEYENTAKVPIRNPVIRVKLQGKAFDLSSLKIDQQGSFDSLTNTIIWESNVLPELSVLEPGEKGKLNFWINLKYPLPISSYQDKNFKVRTIASITSNQIPLTLQHIQIGSQSELEVLIKTDLTLQTKAFFNNSLISNYGSIPPRVGRKTAYTIVWQLTNTANDVINTQVKALLPSYVKWTGRIEPKEADLKYNPVTHQVIWNVDYLPAGTGIILPVRQVAFQIEVVPSITQVGDLIKLIDESKVSGLDNFVNQEVVSTAKSIFSDLPDDPTISRDEGIVRE